MITLCAGGRTCSPLGCGSRCAALGADPRPRLAGRPRLSSLARWENRCTKKAAFLCKQNSFVLSRNIPVGLSMNSTLRGWGSFIPMDQARFLVCLGPLQYKVSDIFPTSKDFDWVGFIFFISLPAKIKLLGQTHPFAPSVLVS